MTFSHWPSARPNCGGVSLGKTVSDLMRKGLNAPTPARDKNGLVVFQLPEDSPKVTTDDVRRIEVEGV